MLTRRAFAGLASAACVEHPSIGWALDDGRAQPRGDNLFPNSQWQLFTAIGPSWAGDPSNLSAHLDSFESEWNWLYTGPIPTMAVSELHVDAQTGSGAVTVTATCDDNVKHLYPGAVIVFSDRAPASLRISTVRVRSVDYQHRRFTFIPARNQRPPEGRVDCECRQVMRCDRRGVTDRGPDGWWKTTSALLWLDRWPPAVAASAGAATPAWACNQRPSTHRCVVFAPNDDAPARFFYKAEDSFRGRTISFGMWVNRVSGGSARLFVDDGAVTYGAQKVEAGGWSWIEMSHAVSPSASSIALGVEAVSSRGAAWRLAEPRLDYGEGLGEGAYVRPKGRIEPFTVKMTPDSYFGASIDFGPGGGLPVDLSGETTLAIAEDVPLIFGQLEGAPETAGQPLFTRNQYAPPVRYGAAIYAPVAREMAASAVPFDLGDDGTLWLYSNPGASWRHVSIDLDRAVLG